VQKVDTTRLKSSLRNTSKEEFSQCPFDYEEEAMAVRKCIPVPPFLATLLLCVEPSDPHQMGYKFTRLIFERETILIAYTT
jgi:hypothetical protein